MHLQPSPRGVRLVDSAGRSRVFRGVSVAGSNKLPASSKGSHDPAGIADHRAVSFVNRPFVLEKAPKHLERLRAWGFNLVRLLVTWEALEPGGPGEYDQEYIKYLVDLLSLFQDYDLHCIIDAHQDVYSRLSGGSGAPGWTLELAGFDISALNASGAAYQHSFNIGPNNTPASVWPSGYQKLAPATMNTLFWAADIFAWKRTVPSTYHKNHALFPSDVVDIGLFLRTSMVEAFGVLADAIKSLPAVIGLEPMNEPHRGYISLYSFDKWNPMTDLTIASCPSALQSMALGDGHPQKVPYYVKSFPHPTRLARHDLITPPTTGAWLPDSPGCVWKQHGVWHFDNNKKEPHVDLPNYFSSNPRTGEPIDWYEDCWFPFVNTFAARVHRSNPSWLIFAGPVPNEFCPPWPKHKQPPNFVYAPHFYDLHTLFSKSFGNWTVNVQGLSRGLNPLKAIYFGRNGVKKNYALQVSNIVENGRKATEGAPCIIGESGVPFDMNNNSAFKTGDYYWQERMMDALWHSTEKANVDLVLWNYCPTNTHTHGDSWYLEDFSNYGNDDREPNDDSIDNGARTLNAFKRPRAFAIAGIPISTEYEMNTGTYKLSFANPSLSDEAIKSQETDIFVPFKVASVEVSDGTYCVINDTNSLDEKRPQQEQQMFIRYTHTNMKPDYIHKVKIVMHVNHIKAGRNMILDLAKYDKITFSSFFVIFVFASFRLFFS